MGQIKAVVFDIGKVLIEWHPERFYDSMIGIERRREFFADVDIYAMNEHLDLGAPFRETVYAFADKHPEYSAQIRLWHDSWIKMAAPEISGSVHLLRAIRTKGIPVFALSNFGIGPFDVASKHYPFFNEFDQKYISGHLQEIKPHARIYELLEQGSGLLPASLLFTDDVRKNVDAAAARGWQTHHFDGPAGWAKALVQSEVLTAEEAAL
ncbi:HAD-IA family hydrolase [Profundibacter sp.]